MSIDNPVGGGPKDPYDKHREQLEAIEREKKEKEGQAPKESLISLAHILLWMRNVLGRLSKPAATSQELKTKLIELKEFFETIKKEDRSQDYEFSSRFSKTWNEALEANLHKKNPQFRMFIKEIQSYPAGQEYSLGYYLTENAGQHWLPFPYIELLQKLHWDHDNHPSDSALTRWTSVLTELITGLAE